MNKYIVQTNKGEEIQSFLLEKDGPSCVTVIIVVGIIAYAAYKGKQEDVELRKQEVNKEKIIQERKLQQSKEHTKWLPWSKEN